MTNYSKNLQGIRGHVFIGTATVYTTQATFALFINNAVEGELGVYTAAGARQTAALVAGDQFFLAQKKDGQISKTPILNFNDIYSKRKTIYDAPVKQIATIGFLGTGTLDLSTNFATITAGTSQTLGLSIRNTVPSNQPFPVQEGYAVATSSADNEYTRIAQLVANFNQDFDYEKASPDIFAYAEILQSSTTTAITVAATLSVIQGVNQVVFNAAPTGAPAVGEYIAIGGTGQTGAVYKITAIAADTVTYTLDRPYAAATNAALAIANVLKAPFVSGTSLMGIRITAVTTDDHFVVNVTDGLLNSPITATTDWKLGAGYGAAIQALEDEGQFFAGVGSVKNAAFSADYGLPTKFALAASNYDQIYVDLQPSMRPSAGLPVTETKQIQRLLIAAPTAASPSSVLQTIFGV